jgi:hypothetical protein
VTSLLAMAYMDSAVTTSTNLRIRASLFNQILDLYHPREGGHHRLRV